MSPGTDTAVQNAAGTPIVFMLREPYSMLEPENIRTCALNPQKFFDRYGKMVRYSCAQRVRDMVTAGGGCPSGAHALSDTESLQIFALRWLMGRPGVGCTVVEMEQKDHADAAFLALRQD